VQKPDQEQITHWVNDFNEKMTRETDRVVNAIFCVFIGILGGLALVHWLTPCAEGVLC
jgi:hypothetical protein